MGKNNVNRAILIAGFGVNNKFNPDTAQLLALTEKLSNISVVGSVDVLQYKKSDLEELEQWMKNKNIVGLKLYTGYQHVYPNDTRCIPLYELCLAHKIPVIFHSGDTLAGVVSNPKVKYSHPLHIDDVATDFPELKIIIAHLGNPWLVDCAEVLYKNPNVYADISGLIIGDHLAASSSNDLEIIKRKIKELLVYVGANKLLYGTDWPICSMETYLLLARGLGLQGAELDKLLYKNTVDVFNLRS